MRVELGKIKGQLRGVYVKVDHVEEQGRRRLRRAIPLPPAYYKAHVSSLVVDGLFPHI